MAQQVKKKIQGFFLKRITYKWKNQVSKDLQIMPERFEGLYQPIRMTVEETLDGKDALGEWAIRANALLPNSTLARITTIFNDPDYGLDTHYASVCLSECFGLAGITFDKPNEQGEIFLDALKVTAYHALDGHRLEVGESAPMLAPAWYYKEKIIEHGTIGSLEALFGKEQ